MLLPADAFAHVPVLAGKILEPEKSIFRISRETFVRMGPACRRKRATATTGDARTRSGRQTRSEALAGRLDRDLWIFAYGSLMWDPAIHVVEIRPPRSGLPPALLPQDRDRPRVEGEAGADGGLG